MDPSERSSTFLSYPRCPTYPTLTPTTDIIQISIQVIDLHKAAIADRSGLGEPLTFEVLGPKRGWRFVADGKVRVCCMCARCCWGVVGTVK